MTASRTTRRTAAKVETPEEKLARLESTLEDLYAQRDTLDDKITLLEEEIAQFGPPLIAGDIAANKQGARVKVLEVSPAFDSHVARVVFVDKTNKVKDGKVYTYDVTDLELLEEAK